MLTKSILTTAAIALVAGLGSASAGEQFTSLAGIAAEVMSSQSMGEVRGGDGDAVLNVGPSLGVNNQHIGPTDTVEIGLFIAARILSIQDAPVLIRWLDVK